MGIFPFISWSSININRCVREMYAIIWTIRFLPSVSTRCIYSHIYYIYSTHYDNQFITSLFNSSTVKRNSLACKRYGMVYINCKLLQTARILISISSIPHLFYRIMNSHPSLFLERVSIMLPIIILYGTSMRWNTTKWCWDGVSQVCVIARLLVLPLITWLVRESNFGNLISDSGNLTFELDSNFIHVIHLTSGPESISVYNLSQVL